MWLNHTEAGFLSSGHRDGDIYSGGLLALPCELAQDERPAQAALSEWYHGGVPASRPQSHHTG